MLVVTYQKKAMRPRNPRREFAFVLNDVARLLRTYADLGVNTLRVNGVGFLEKKCFYDLCDELGLLVWQDVPLSSSGVDNCPPDDETVVIEVAAILAISAGVSIGATRYRGRPASTSASIKRPACGLSWPG